MLRDVGLDVAAPFRVRGVCMWEPQRRLKPAATCLAGFVGRNSISLDLLFTVKGMTEID